MTLLVFMTLCMNCILDCKSIDSGIDCWNCQQEEVIAKTTARLGRKSGKPKKKLIIMDLKKALVLQLTPFLMSLIY